MNESSSQHIDGRPRLPIPFTFFTAALLLLVSACNSSAPSVSQTEQQADAADSASTTEQCDRDIDNLLDALQPDRFGISSNLDVTVNMLNTWLAQCGESQEFSTDEREAELRATLLLEPVNAQAALQEFTLIDAAYLRDSILLRQMVDSTLTDERTDLERAVTLFYKVVRTVDLTRDNQSLLSFGPFQTLLFGRGRPEDRAWIYAMMLRHLRLDAVVIRPRAAQSSGNRSLLVGVVIPEEGVYLFDFRLGVPVASAEDDSESPLPLTPVTLATAREHDAVFRQFDLRGASYPVNAKQMAECDILAIGTGSTWSPRFGKLQSALPLSLGVYEGLTANSLQELGIIDRLTEVGQAGLWKPGDVGVWDYPDRLLFSAMSMTQQQRQELQRQSIVMQAPYSVSVDQATGKIQFAPPERSLQQARIGHIQGDIESALEVYLRSRLSIPHPQTPNKAAANWSTYWAALAQYEREDFVVASQSADHYLKAPGFWTLAAMSLRANGLAQEQEFDEAVRVLAREPVRAPQHLGNQYLVRRWRRLAKGESAIDPSLTAVQETPDNTTPEPASPADEPMPGAETSAVESPQDLPPAEEPPDPRFEKETPEDLPPAEQAPDTSAKQVTSEESASNSDTPEPTAEDDSSDDE